MDDSISLPSPNETDGRRRKRDREQEKKMEMVRIVKCMDVGHNETQIEKGKKGNHIVYVYKCVRVCILTIMDHLPVCLSVCEC